jgi:hypothetical protein
MQICPIDLATCQRPECRGGWCAGADMAILVLCWRCGSLDAEHRRVGDCTQCLRSDEAG